MSVSLNPITIAKLDHFRRRRRTMLLLRGISAAVVVFLISMLLVSIADWLWVMSSATRWSLSAAGYATSIAVVYGLCVRRMRRDTDRREMATRVEAAEPALREQLLSAIELGDVQPGSAANGSEQFRAMVQDSVAGTFAGIDVRRLLPFGLIGRWLLAAVVIIGLCAALWLIPGSRFRQLITRAMLPMANIDRVSRTQVEVLKPSPASLQVPEDETVAVVVRITGALTDDVTLELFPTEGDSSEQPMRRQSSAGSDGATDDNVFSANISVGKMGLDYRILAGDAVTRTYRIRTAPRPAIESIEKTYHFPGYTELADQVVSEDHGDLEALVGTSATVQMQINQPVSIAEIVYTAYGDEEPRRIPMQPVPDVPNAYTAELPIEQPEVYQVHLVAKDTGFDDPFRPKYEIRPVPDRIPRVMFVDPPLGTLLLPSNDLLPLVVGVEDELPVHRVMVEVSINSSPWKAQSLDVESAAKTETPLEWDLADWELKAGDRVSLRAAAIDRKGQRGESAPLQIVIATPDFDPDRHTTMEAKLALLPAVRDWSSAVDAFRDRLDATLKPIAEGKSEALDAAERTRSVTQAKQLQNQSDLLIADLVEVLPEMPTSYDAAALELLGRSSDRVRYSLQRLVASLETEPVSEEESERKKAATQLRQQLASAADLAERAHNGYEAVVSHDVNAGVLLDIDGIAGHVERLVLPSIKTSWERLQRQHTVTINQVTALREMIQAMSPQVSSSSRGPLQQVDEWLDRWKNNLYERMAGQHQADELRRVTEQFYGELRQRLKNASLDGGLPGRISNEYYDVDRRIGSVAESILWVRNDLNEAYGGIQKAEQTGTSEAMRAANANWLETVGDALQTQPQIAKRLASWRELHQMRRDSDKLFPGDAALGSRALAAVLSTTGPKASAGEATPQKLVADLSEIAAAYQILEAGHETIQLRNDLSSLAEAERWDALSIQGRTIHPMAWDQLQKANELVLQRTREAGLPETVWRPIDQMRWSPATQTVKERMGVRRWDAGNVVSASGALSTKREEIDVAVAALEPEMIAARQRLAAFVPTAAQLARTTADQLRKLSEQTKQAAESAKEQAEQTPAAELEEQAAAAVEELRAEQESASEQIDALLDALVDQANEQDLMTSEGRETARDADDAMAMITPPAKAMDKEMQQAAAAEKADAAAEKLTEAAESQAETAEALELVAEHLERQAAGEDLQETRQALRDAEQEMGLERQLEQQYSQAEKMAEAVSQSPQDLLQQLEAELQRNEAMQEALSEIAAQTMQQAQNMLEQSARAEQAIQRDVERRDEAFQARKAVLAEQLKQLTQAVDEATKNLLNPAQSAANQSRDEAAKQELQNARDSLQAAKEATQAIQPDSLLNDMAKAANQAADALQQASDQLAKAEQKSEAAADESIHQSEQELRAQRDRMQRDQSQVKANRQRDAESATKQARQEEKQASSEVSRAEKQQREAESQQAKAERELKKKPDEQWAKDNVAKAQEQVAAAQQQRQIAEQFAETKKQQREQAEQNEQQRKQWQTDPLNKPNPAAQLAQRLSQEAAKAAEQMRQQAEQVAKDANFGEQLQGDAQQLARAEQQQQAIGKDVEQTAADLARAARHEQRLQKQTAADLLAKEAQAVEQASRQELTQAEQAVAEAAQAVAPEPQDAGQSPPADDGNRGQADVAQAQQAMGAAEAELQARADALQGQLDADTQAKADAQASADPQAAMEGSSQPPANAQAGTPPPSGEGAQPGSEPQPSGSPQPSDAAQANASPAGSPPSPSSMSPNGESASPSASPAPNAMSDPARAQQLARALDELDRAMNASPGEAAMSQAQAAAMAQAAAAQAQAEAMAGDASPSEPADAQAMAAQAQAQPQAMTAAQASQTLAQAAAARAQSMAIARAQQRSQAAPPSPSSESAEPGDGTGPEPPDMFELERVKREAERDWGQLTVKSAEDLTEGRRDPVSERYRQQVEAYFRVIAEQANPK